jgi:hypothetical protein
MSGRKRLHREDPARKAPIRNFSKLYSKPETSNGATGAKPFPSEKSQRAKAMGPLAEGVELAYTVIEKYITEGRRIAEGLNTQPYASKPANDHLEDILERVLHLQAELVPLWMDTLTSLVKVEPQNGHVASRGVWPHANGKIPERTAVEIDVASVRPVQVFVELRQGSKAGSLLALDLNSVDPGKPSLTQVSFVPSEIEGRAKLRVRIPDKQPTGTYAGVVVNRDSGETLGTLNIRVAD